MASTDNEYTVSHFDSKSINGLPVELLISIFTFVIHSSYRVDSQFCLSWVCRYWRQVIFRTSNLWTIISFGSPDKHSIEYIEKVTQASGSKELVVFGPGRNDIDINAETSTNMKPLQSLFRDFLLCEHKRIKALSLGNYKHNVKRLPKSVLENIRALSMTQLSLPFNLLAGAQNLRALQITVDSDQLPKIIDHIPRHITKLSLRLSHNVGVHRVFSEFKILEYLSIIFMKEYQKYGIRPMIEDIALPNLTSLKSNSSGPLIDTLDAPVLRRLEITTKGDHSEDREFKLLNSMELSKFTHLYIGYIPNLKTTDPVDGCIWATVGPTRIPCLEDKPTVYRCRHDINWTTWPSSWSIFPQCPHSDSDIESLIHIHSGGTHILRKEYINLPCKLVAEMISLDTLVLCFPTSQFPPSHFTWNHLPKYLRHYYEFRTAKLFNTITQSHSLRNLIVRTTSYYGKDAIETLSTCFGEQWTSDSCPLLESITYEAHSFKEDADKFWNVWLKFLNQRISIGRPLRHLRLIGCPSPPEEIMSRINELSSETNIIWIKQGSEEDSFQKVTIFRKSDSNDDSDDSDLNDNNDDSQVYPTRDFF